VIDLDTLKNKLSDFAKTIHTLDIVYKLKILMILCRMPPFNDLNTHMNLHRNVLKCSLLTKEEKI
jgi:hypothetical protein